MSAPVELAVAFIEAFGRGDMAAVRVSGRPLPVRAVSLANPRRVCARE
jgi:hypothetical protein